MSTEEALASCFISTLASGLEITGGVLPETREHNFAEADTVRSAQFLTTARYSQLSHPAGLKVSEANPEATLKKRVWFAGAVDHDLLGVLNSQSTDAVAFGDAVETVTLMVVVPLIDSSGPTFKKKKKKKKN